MNEMDETTLKDITITPFNMSLDELDSRIRRWHRDRNLIDGSTDAAQMLKLQEEIGELAGNIARGRPVADDIGDALVVLNNIAARNGYTLQHCAATAYNDIKDRRGRMVDGVFIKETDR